MSGLAHLSDAQLLKRIEDLAEDYCEEPVSTRREIGRALDKAESELAMRKQSRLHDVHAGHFASLIRDDLAFSRKDGDEWLDLGPEGDDSVTLVDDTRSYGPDLVQCTRGDYDYCVDEGASWNWVPLAFGPVQELPPAVAEKPCDLCGVLTLPDFLEDVSELLFRGRACCPACVDLLEQERGYEERASEQLGPLHEVEGWH